MTPEQIRTILAADTALLELARENPGDAATQLSMERTEWAPTEIGIGTIIDALGIQAGNAVLDVIKNTPDYRYVWALIEQGRLRLDWASTRENVAALVTVGVITQIQADALLARARATVSEHVSWIDVRNALEGM